MNFEMEQEFYYYYHCFFYLTYLFRKSYLSRLYTIRGEFNRRISTRQNMSSVGLSKVSLDTL